MIRLTSDLHFNHPLIAKLRGFTKLDINDNVIGDTDAHDEAIIENFNSGVRPGDITIVAGDFAMNWKGVERQLSQLRGRLILVEGNHDIMSSIHRDGWRHRAAWTGPGKFEAIVAYMRRKTKNAEYIISHYPYTGDHTATDRNTMYRLRDEGMWLLHGHTHSKEKITPYPDLECFFCGKTIAEGCPDQAPRPVRQIHVGLDAWGLKPVQERDVIEMMNSLDRERGDGQDVTRAELSVRRELRKLFPAHARRRCRGSRCAGYHGLVQAVPAAEQRRAKGH